MDPPLHGRSLRRIERRKARVQDDDVAYVHHFGAGVGDRLRSPGNHAQDRFLSRIGDRDRGVGDQCPVLLPGLKLRLVNNNVRAIPVNHSWPGGGGCQRRLLRRAGNSADGEAHRDSHNEQTAEPYHVVLTWSRRCSSKMSSERRLEAYSITARDTKWHCAGGRLESVSGRPKAGATRGSERSRLRLK